MSSTEAEKVDLAGFDVFVKAQEEGKPVSIVHPETGSELGPVIYVAGPDSERARKARQRAVNETLKSQRMKQQTAVDIEVRAIRQLAELVTGWRDVVVDGHELEPTLDNVVMVFRRWPFIREQVDAEAGSRAGFTKP